jgi:type I restriction enzyme S subunit
MAKTLYDYWFVQFDFPNENGKPYKSSGGKMIWNEKLKRDIPEEWKCVNLLDIATFTNGIACQNFRPQNDENFLRVIKIKEMHEGFSFDSEFVKEDIPDKIKVFNGDILFSWSASLEVILWTKGDGALNQHIFKVASDQYPKSFYYFQLLNYVNHFKKMAEARKTTMGHITQDHLQQSTIAVPSSKKIAEKFEYAVDSLFQKIIITEKQNQELTQLRDWLLPMLMNGQVAVNYHLTDCIVDLFSYLCTFIAS